MGSGDFPLGLSIIVVGAIVGACIAAGLIGAAAILATTFI